MADDKSVIEWLFSPADDEKQDEFASYLRERKTSQDISRVEAENEKLRGMAEGYGLDVPDEEGRSFFSAAIDALTTPMQLVEGGVSALLGLPGYEDENIFSGALKGAKEDISASEMFRKGDILQGSDFGSSFLRGLTTFGVDVGLDPATYAAPFSRGFTPRVGGKHLTKEGFDIYKGMLTKELGQVDDIVRTNTDLWASFGQPVTDSVVGRFTKQAHEAAHTKVTRVFQEAAAVADEQKRLARTGVLKALKKAGDLSAFGDDVTGLQGKLLEVSRKLSIDPEGLDSLFMKRGLRGTSLFATPNGTIPGLTKMDYEFPYLTKGSEKLYEALGNSYYSLKSNLTDTYIEGAAGLKGSGNKAGEAVGEGMLQIADLISRGKARVVNLAGHLSKRVATTGELFGPSRPRELINEHTVATHNMVQDIIGESGILREGLTDAMLEDVGQTLIGPRNRSVFRNESKRNRFLKKWGSEALDNFEASAFEKGIRHLKAKYPEQGQRLEGLVRMIKHNFEEFQRIEKGLGIEYNVQDWYLHQLYDTSDEVKAFNELKQVDIKRQKIATVAGRNMSGGVGGADFTLEKYFTTANEAANYGLTPNKNVLDLYMMRSIAHKKAVAEKEFFERFALQHGLRPQAYAALRHMALDSGVDAAFTAKAALRNAGFPIELGDLVPGALKDSELKALVELPASKKTQEILGRQTPKFSKTEFFDSALDPKKYDESIEKAKTTLATSKTAATRKVAKAELKKLRESKRALVKELKASKKVAFQQQVTPDTYRKWVEDSRAALEEGIGKEKLAQAREATKALQKAGLRGHLDKRIYDEELYGITKHFERNKFQLPETQEYITIPRTASGDPISRKYLENIFSQIDSTFPGNAEKQSAQRLWDSFVKGGFPQDRLKALELADAMDAAHKSVRNSIWGRASADAFEFAGASTLRNQKAIEAVKNLPDSHFYLNLLPAPMVEIIEDSVVQRDFLKTTLSKLYKDDEAMAKALDWALGAFDAALIAHKGAATLPFPSFHLRNAYAMPFQMAQVMPVLGQSLSIPNMVNYYKVRKGTTTALTAAGEVLDKKKLLAELQSFQINTSLEDLMDLMVSGTDQVIAAAEEAARHGSKEARHFIPEAGKHPGFFGKATNKLRGLSEAIERGGRQMGYYNLRMQGYSPADAAAEVSRVFVDYARGKTPFERSVMNRLLFFYSFSRTQASNTLISLMERPSALTSQIHAFNGAAEIFTDPEALPQFEDLDEISYSMRQRDGFTKIIGEGASGLPLVMTSAGLPIEDAASLLTPMFDQGVQREVQLLAARANPLLKGLIEFASGKDLFYGRDITDETLRKVASWQRDMDVIIGAPFHALPKATWDGLDAATKAVLGGNNNPDGTISVDPVKLSVLAAIVPGLSRLNSTRNALTDPSTSSGAKYARLLSGVKAYEIDPAASKAYDINRDLKELIRASGRPLTKKGFEQVMESQ